VSDTFILKFPVGPGIRRRISHFFLLRGLGLFDPSQSGATGDWDPQKVRPMSLHRPHFFRPKKWISFVSVMRANWEFQVNKYAKPRMQFLPVVEYQGFQSTAPYVWNSAALP
jgi:hypothetical protein